MTHDEHIETMRDNYDDHGAELAAKDAEIERLRELVYAYPPTENTTGQTWKEAAYANREEVSRLDAMMRTYRLPDEVVDIKVVIELRAEIERLRDRVNWFEKAGGVAMATKIYQHIAEIERLRTALVADDEGSTAYQSGWHARDAEIERLRGELAECERVGGKFMEEIEQLRYDLGLEQHSNARLRGEHQEYVATAMALQNAVAEIERLRKLKEHPYPRERTWSDCEAELQQLRDELAREKQEHDRCTTFHAIAVKERNYERVLALKRDAEIERLRKELAEKDDYIRTVSRPIGAHSYE